MQINSLLYYYYWRFKYKVTERRAAIAEHPCVLEFIELDNAKRQWNDDAFFIYLQLHPFPVCSRRAYNFFMSLVESCVADTTHLFLYADVAMSKQATKKPTC